MPLVRLETPLAALNLHDLFEWLVRQVQYLRFIFPGIWIAMGVWSLLQVVTFVAAVSLVAIGAVTLTPTPTEVVSAIYLAALVIILLQIRFFHPTPCAPAKWLVAGLLLLPVFAAAMVVSGLRREIRWRGFYYRVGNGGRVLAIRQSNPATATGS